MMNLALESECSEDVYKLLRTEKRPYSLMVDESSDIMCEKECAILVRKFQCRVSAQQCHDSTEPETIKLCSAAELPLKSMIPDSPKASNKEAVTSSTQVQEQEGGLGWGEPQDPGDLAPTELRISDADRPVEQVHSGNDGQHQGVVQEPHPSPPSARPGETNSRKRSSSFPPPGDERQEHHSPVKKTRGESKAASADGPAAVDDLRIGGVEIRKDGKMNTEFISYFSSKKRNFILIKYLDLPKSGDQDELLERLDQFKTVDYESFNTQDGWRNKINDIVKQFEELLRGKADEDRFNHICEAFRSDIEEWWSDSEGLALLSEHINRTALQFFIQDIQKLLQDLLPLLLTDDNNNNLRQENLTDGTSVTRASFLKFIEVPF
ncbi:hypothetical protein MHYP_G00168920 [Metynnis hypsauchen]